MASTETVRDLCPSYLACAETVDNLLLPAETVVHNKWLPAESISMIPFLLKRLVRNKSHGQSQQEAIPPVPPDISVGRKQDITDILGGAKYDGQPRQEANIGSPVSAVGCLCMYGN